MFLYFIFFFFIPYFLLYFMLFYFIYDVLLYILRDGRRRYARKHWCCNLSNSAQKKNCCYALYVNTEVTLHKNLRSRMSVTTTTPCS